MAATLALAPACSQTSGQVPGPVDGEPRIRLGAAPSGQRTVDVKGLPAEDLAHLEQTPPARDGWQALLRVHVARTAPTSTDLPPVLGTYGVRDGALRFTPRFPFDPGQRYEVVFDPSSLPSVRRGSVPVPLRPLSTTVEIPAPVRTPSTRVVAVYPTAPEVPANHLRLYIAFSAPMGLGEGASHIRLLDEHGRALADAFLPLEVDLWNADRTRFTVLYDPGRVKRGILPNEELGRPLAAGRTYTLVIDADWRDAAGQPLVAPFRREFRVGPPREHALDPADWRLEIPVQGTREPLAARFPAPLDYGLLQRALRVATETGQPLDGEIRVEEGETRWVFTPSAPWQSGQYQLVAAATLEDVAGNRIGRPFEVDETNGSGTQRARGAQLPFQIRGSGAAGREWTAAPGADFPLTGGNYWHQRYSTLDQINASNVTELGAAWLVGLEGGRPGGQLEGTPVVVDGVMYVSTGTRSVLALDAATGAVKWRYRPESAAPGGNKGVVVAEGKVFFGRRDGVLVALDQETGKVVWETQLTAEQGAYVSAPAVYHEGLVYMGTSGGDSGARGQMGAYDANTGAEVWKFYTIPGADDRFADTWEGDSYKNGGGGVWVSPTVDPELGLIYMSVGNIGLRQYGAADRNPEFRDEGDRGFDNLFTGSILALDLKTGDYRWHFQQVRHDIWHYDAGGPSVLADITYQGRPRKILMHPGKTGYLYILDRTDGTPLIGIEEREVSQETRMKTAPTQPFPIGDSFVPLCPEPLGDHETGCLFAAYDERSRLIAPGSAGGNSWAPMTFSPRTGLAYVPGTIFDSLYTLGAEGAGRELQSTTYHPPGVRRAGTLTAMDPTTSRIVWQQQMKYPMGGGSGLLSTAGGLLFSGRPDGHLVAYDIRNGEQLWRFQTGAGADAGVSTYEVDGEQYVAIMAGGNRVLRSERGDYLWAFKLGATLPEAPAPQAPPLIQP